MNTQKLCIVSLTALLTVSVGGANAQQATFFVKTPGGNAPVVAPYTCTAPVNLVVDVADENLHTTSAIFGTSPGGGEGKQFDPNPLLTTSVTLKNGQCLDAHLSALAGGPNFYGASNLALFQVALTGKKGPVHMYGHYETPYGFPSPAVALGAEPDVDMLGANFIQHVGKGVHDVPPGTYKVEVYWAGAPNAGGAIGAAFVLKLYTSK
jgi:hypothetical protein